jgi:hypothetical protein
MNRQTLVDGIDDEQQTGAATDHIGHIADPSDATRQIAVGHVLSYDLNGNRATDTHWGNHVQTTDGYDVPYDIADNGRINYYHVDATYNAQPGQVTDNYSYDGLNRLASTLRDGVVIDTRLYDAAGRTVNEGPTSLPNGYYAALNTGVAQDELIGMQNTINRFDAEGHVLQQRVLNPDGSLKVNVTNTYDAAGNLSHYVAGNPDTSSDYTYTTARYEGYKEFKVTGAVSGGPTGSTTDHYDLNGNLIGLTDSTMGTNDRTLVNDISGQVLMVNQAGHLQRQVVVNGEVLGRYGVGIDTLKARNDDGSPRFAPVDRTGAEFGFGYAPISSSQPAAGVGAYTVQSGDTLQSIAAGAYGDSALWFRIAQANGLSGNGDLKVGQTLAIPSGVQGTHNNAGTFKPYDPSKVVGDTSPNLPAPPAKDSGCGVVGQIIILVVVVIVAYFTQQWYLANYAAPATAYTGAALEGSTLTLTTATEYSAADMAVAAAAGGAAGSVAGQAVAMAAGMQNSFDWSQVGLAAIGGAVGGALTGSAPLGGNAASLGNTVVRSAIGNAITQGIGVATGLQEKFNWRGVAAAAAGSGVGHLLNEGLGLTDKDGKPAEGMGASERLAKATLSGLSAGIVAAMARGGRVSVERVAADAFGNALGEGLARGDFDGGSINDENKPEPWAGPGLQPVRSTSGLQLSASTVEDWSERSRSGISQRARELADQTDSADASQGTPSTEQGSDWRLQQVAALVRANRHSEAAELLATDVRMTSEGRRNFDSEGIKLSDGDALAFKAPSLPDSVKNIPQQVLPTAEEKALPMLEQTAGSGLRLPGWLTTAGRWLTRGGVGLQLLTFMPEAPTTDWKAGGAKFSYNPDDALLRIKDDETGKTVAVPEIHNPSQYSDAQYLSYVSYKANGGKLTIDDFVNFDPPSMGPVDRASREKPEWLKRLDAGNAFNKERSVAYPYNEVYVNKPSGEGYFRVDSYNPNTREIVSRKFTQFSEISEQTGIDYVNELGAKYPDGAKIANVPTNIKNGLAGKLLTGDHILEVPVQRKPIPPAGLDAANRASVLIRDINGKIY